MNYTSSAGAPVIEDINPKIAEIQLRVEELVRRYDDAVAAVDHEEEEDSFGDKPSRTPARWRVGDVLLATHRSLARTSTHTERTMVSDFSDDPEVSSAIGSGAQKVGDAFTEASEQAARRHQRLSHIHQALQSAAANVFLDDSEEDEEDEKMSPYGSREKQLRSTIDALHREKDSLAAQLQEALRMQQDARVATEQHAQELTRAQRQLRALVEELRSTQEHNDKATEAANALTVSWRDKFQVSAKAAASAEARVHELEAKVRSQSEEIIKHTFVLQAKSQEMERLKESEAARSRAEAAAHAAALAQAEEEARRAKAKAIEAKRKSKLHADEGNKDLREMEDKICELEGTLLAAENVKQGLETENEDLLRRLRELQARFGEQRKLKFEGGKQPETNAPESTFALRLRENSTGVNTRKKQRGGVVVKPTSSGGSKPTSTAPPTPVKSDGELSSSESEADSDTEEMDEVERDERELNHVLKLVVATVFPVFSPEESDEVIDDSIAQYEDPVRSPLNEIQPSQVEPLSVLSSDESLVDRSELDKLRTMYEHEVDALKQQYVDGLQEYKRLVIEQYDRRRAIERERHRLEIEGLLRLIQTKFHAELSRRSERLKQAKESLKELYNALRQHSGPATEPQDFDEDVNQPFNAAMPLKTLLRAAILAMSTSAKRNGRGRTQIEAIHEQLTKILPPPDTRTSAVAAAMTIHTAIRTIKPENTIAMVDNWSQTDVLPVPRERSLEIITIDQRIAPKSLDGYVLPGSPCFPHSKPELKGVMLHLVAGAPISRALMAELRQLLPNLPPGNYYVSSALRLALFREVVRFYAAVEMQFEASKPRPNAKSDTIQDADVVVGSPRDTPFLRRKALETIENNTRQRNRRHLFSSGGTAILQTFTSTSPHSR
ncbi:hypothetical protein P3T76_002043 [Phytophthora citrophthora]|uniref:Uncharacterized protein n=1 Tax=Phytophthora citrophthora TaxID=4793 RepID=A0AAD9LQY1_9STRA|nr:hypothetical protein P3T76_002043 [Phytophthora citrophthora]